MRIVLITRRFWPSADSIERMLANLTTELIARRHDVTVLTDLAQPTWPKHITFRNASVVRFPYSKPGRFSAGKYVRGLGKWLKEHEADYDAVVVSRLQYEAAAAVDALGGRKPVVLRAEQPGKCGDCLWQLETPGGEKLKKSCLAADAFIGPSRGLQRELQAAGYPRDRIHLIQHGVPLPELRSPTSQITARMALAAANQAMSLRERAPLAVYHGCMRHDQGAVHLVKAWTKVVAQRPNARLWLVGEESDNPALVRTIELLELDGRVIPVGAFDIPDELFAAADLVVSPAFEEDALVIGESMAAGLPVVASDTPGNRALVDDGRHGLLVPPRDSDAIADAVSRLFDSPQTARRMGLEGRNRAENEFTLAQMTDRHVTLLQELVEKSAAT